MASTTRSVQNPNVPNDTFGNAVRPHWPSPARGDGPKPNTILCVPGNGGQGPSRALRSSAVSPGSSTVSPARRPPGAAQPTVILLALGWILWDQMQMPLRAPLACVGASPPCRWEHFLPLPHGTQRGWGHHTSLRPPPSTAERCHSREEAWAPNTRRTCCISERPRSFSS